MGRPVEPVHSTLIFHWTVLFAALEPSDKNNTIYEIEDLKYEVSLVNSAPAVHQNMSGLR